MRFTNAVANQGFAVIHLAIVPRRSASGVPKGNVADVRKNFGCIFVPSDWGSSSRAYSARHCRGDFEIGRSPAAKIRPVVRHHFETAFDGRLNRPHGDPRKERRELVELLALPTVGLVIVALGTLNLDAEEDPRHLGRRFFGAALLGQLDRRCAVFADVARRCDELRRDLVPRLVLVELFG